MLAVTRYPWYHRLAMRIPSIHSMERTRLYMILVGIIAITVPCYCAGWIAIRRAPPRETRLIGRHVLDVVRELRVKKAARVVSRHREKAIAPQPGGPNAGQAFRCLSHRFQDRVSFRRRMIILPAP